MAPSTGFHTLTEQPKETPPFSLIFPQQWLEEGNAGTEIFSYLFYQHQHHLLPLLPWAACYLSKIIIPLMRTLIQKIDFSHIK